MTQRQHQQRTDENAMALRQGRSLNKLIDQLRVCAHLLRGPFRFGAEAYYCTVYANLLSDRMNRKPEFIASAKRALRDARARLAFHVAFPTRIFA